MMTRPNTPHSELDWQAFQYAAGELQGAELEAFELRLATDLEACEALAKAVVLGQVVAAAEHRIALTAPAEATLSGRDSSPAQRSTTPHHATNVVAAVRHRSNWNAASRRVCALIGSAACLAAMTVWLGPDRVPRQAPLATEHTVGIASLWVAGGEPGTELDFETHPDDDLELAQSRLHLNADVNGAFSTDDAEELDADDPDEDVPGWLLAAVAEQQRELGDPAPDEEEVLRD